MQNIDLTPVLQAVISLAALLITYRLIPWLKAKMSAEKQAYFAAVVKTLVYAAEQIYKADKGAEKLAYVQRELEARGFDVDTAAIEAAVRELTASGAEEWKGLAPWQEVVEANAEDVELEEQE